MSAATPGDRPDASRLTERVNTLLQVVLQHETAVRAYEKWLAKGRPPGSHVQDWLEAEAELSEFRDLAERLAESNGVLREYVTARDQLEDTLHSTEARSRNLRGLAEAALALTAAASQWEVLQVLTDRARAIIGAHQAEAVFAPGADWSDAMRAISLSDKYGPPRDNGAPVDAASLGGLVRDLAGPLRLTQAELDAQPRLGKLLQTGRRPPLRGCLVTPLLGRDGRRAGLLLASDRCEGDFTEEDELILAQLGQLASAAVEMRHTQIELEGRVHARTAELTRASEALRQEVEHHRRAEEARQQNHALLQALIEGTTDAVYVKDLQGRYLLINSAGARFVGKTAAEVIGKDDSFLFSPETARRLMADDRRIMAAGRTETLEDVGTAAGATHVFFSTKSPYRDPRGNVIGLIGISRDITERKKAERRLHAEHAVTLALAESSTLTEAARKILQAVCENLGWDLGFFWVLDEQGEALRCVQVWKGCDIQATELEKDTRELAYRRGMGLPGQAWAEGGPVWTADVAHDLKTLYRGPVAMQAGLRTALAFPVRSGDEFYGALEFFSRESNQPDGALLDALATITRQISLFMGRQKVEWALHERQREFAIARDIQQGLLPKADPVVPGLAVGGLSLPAQETGGDYFDFFPLADGALAVAVGDASGHGIGAALLMAATRAYLRALALTHADLSQILALANRRLSDDVTEDHFITLVLTRLAPDGRSLTYTNAGHWPGYVLDYRGRVKAALDSTGSVLGFDAASTFPAAPEIPLDPGDLVLLCTDGLAEAFSKAGEPFGKNRILDTVRANRHKAPGSIVQALYQAVRDFSSEQQMDDMTAVVIKIE